MKEKKPPYTPTRMCPHRWCMPLHLAPAPFALAVFVFDLWHNWIFLISLVFGVAMAIWIPRIVHFKPRPRSAPPTLKEVVQDLRESPSSTDLERQDAVYRGTGLRGHLEVRKGWARVAVGCDIVFLAVVGLVATAVFSQPDDAGQVASDASVDAGMFIGLAINAVFFWFWLYAHKKATQPRRPKRAWVPAFLRTAS